MVDHGSGPRPRERGTRVRGRPNPWLYAGLGVLWSALATVSWVAGDSRVLAVAQTVAAVLYIGLCVHARTVMHEPLPPGRSSTSRWGAGRPDERWR